MRLKADINIQYELDPRAHAQLEAIMSRLDDLRSAQGDHAQAVASLGVSVAALADRIDQRVDALEASLTEALGNQVDTADVDALRQATQSLRAISDQVAQMGQDDGSEVPPAGDVDPLEDVTVPDEGQAVEEGTGGAPGGTDEGGNPLNP